MVYEGEFIPEIPDVEATVGATGRQDGLVVRRPLHLMTINKNTIQHHQVCQKRDLI